MIQCGRNSKYPRKIETWRIGEAIPEWLSDVAKIQSVDLGSGKMYIKMCDYDTSGFEITAADGYSPLVRAKNKSDYICYGDEKIFSLTEAQIKLLYKEKKKK